MMVMKFCRQLDFGYKKLWKRVICQNSSTLDYAIYKLTHFNYYGYLYGTQKHIYRTLKQSCSFDFTSKSQTVWICTKFLAKMT